MDDKDNITDLIQDVPVEEVEVPYFHHKGSNWHIDINEVREKIKNILLTYTEDKESQDELFTKLAEEDNTYAIFSMPFFYVIKKTGYCASTHNIRFFFISNCKKQFSTYILNVQSR